MLNRRLLHGRRASLLVTGVSTACLMLAYEATKQALRPALNVWTSHFVAIAFATGLAVALRFVLQQKEERSRRELSAASQAHQRAEEKSCPEALSRGQIEAQLQRNEEKMRLAFDAAKIGFWDWDIVTGETRWSAITSRQMGLPEDSPTSLAIFLNAIHPDDHKAVQASIEAAVQGNKDYAIEYRVLWPEGGVHWRLAKGSVFYDQTGCAVRMVGIVIDIDDRKAADERLLLQAAALQAAANSIVITDNKGAIRWTNQAFSQLTGYSSEEVLGNNPRLWKSGKQDAAFYANMWATIASGNVWHGELTNRRKDRSLYTQEMTITPLHIGNGGITHYVAIKQDVTSRKLAEDKLRQAEMQYRLLFDNNPLPMWVFGCKTLKFLAVNEAAIRHYGFSKQEFLAMTIADIRPEEDIPALLKTVAKSIHGLREAELWRYRKKDGAIIDVEVVSHDLDFHGTPAELVALHDVTERKLAEAALRQAEQKYRSIFENAVLGIFQSTLEGEFLSVNPALAQAAGYDTPQDFLNNVHRISEVYVDPKRPDQLSKLLLAQKVVRDFEAEFRSKDGSKRTVSMNVRAVAGHLGTNFYLDGTMQDITPRKLAEHALQKAEQKYRSIFENAVLGIFQITSEGGFLSVNPAAARIAGYDSPEDFLNSVHCAAELCVDPKRYDELHELLRAQQVVRDFEVEFKT